MSPQPPALVPGLCSVTLRSAGWPEVLAHAVDVGLAAIEWGADVHVPAGETQLAAQVTRACADAGVRCPSYGSYHAAGEPNSQDLGAVLHTAAALGASTVRIWAAWGVEPDAPAGRRRTVTAAIGDAVRRARAYDLRIALEYHPGTLTATAASTRRLLDDLGEDAPLVYWQPLPGQDAATALDDVAVVLPDLAHLHVFHWRPDGTREPLAAGAELWRGVLDRARTSTPRWDRERVAYLEFVRDDDPAHLAADAATLRRWIGDVEDDEDQG